MAKTTFIVSVSGAAAGEGVAELDWEHPSNLDDDGNVRSSFLPGEEPVFVVNLPPEFKIDQAKVRSGCGGATVEPGTVERSREEEASFTDEQPGVSLGYFPNSTPEVVIYSVPETKLSYTLSGKSLTAKNEDLPAIGIINYTAECKQVTYTPPSALELEDETEIFKVVIDIKTS